MIIRVLLVVSAVAMLVTVRRRASTAGLRAGMRLGFVTMIVVFAAAALSPDAVTWLANQVGVGRGADLVLYLLATAFLFLVLATYQKFKESERRIAVLVRHLALLEARAQDPPDDRR